MVLARLALAALALAVGPGLAVKIRGEAEAQGAGFSEDACKAMFERMISLGGPVPPDDFVAGCGEICQQVQEIKAYWKTGDMADYACSTGVAYGCAWPATPPTTLKDIGC
mmetsp:Transcript_36137/g.114911  ORF Transcript_36137/g.114911 Transcript_36137/m.114911 type:complete len:110 (-) Transcript_36137:124-453(-)